MATECLQLRPLVSSSEQELLGLGVDDLTMTEELGAEKTNSSRFSFAILSIAMTELSSKS